MRSVFVLLCCLFEASAGRHSSRISQLKSKVLSACGDCPTCIPCSKPTEWAELKDQKVMPGQNVVPGQNKNSLPPNKKNKEQAKIDYGKTFEQSVIAEDTTNGIISCHKDFSECKKLPAGMNRAAMNGLSAKSKMDIAASGVEERLNCAGPRQGTKCSGVKSGPFRRTGFDNKVPYPVPYSLPDRPFAPDSQDWTRPSIVNARAEGEGAAFEGSDPAPYLKSDTATETGY